MYTIKEKVILVDYTTFLALYLLLLKKTKTIRKSIKEIRRLHAKH
jgi:hypothetical protein